MADRLWFDNLVVVLSLFSDSRPGSSDSFLLGLAFKSLGYDINKIGVSVIECGEKTRLPLFIKVCQSIGIPFNVAIDVDILLIAT